MGGGGRSTTVQTQNLLPEGRAGYGEASGYWRNELEAPTVFGGRRFVEPSAMQRSAAEQGGASFGARSNLQNVSEDELTRTAGGAYFGDAPGMVEALAAPIFRQFNTEVMPGIRDRFAASGGVTATRRGVAEGTAYNDLGESIARGAVVPVYQAERDRQLQAVGMAPELQRMEATRLAGLSAFGAMERGFEQERLAAEQAEFQEWQNRLDEAANTLFGAAGVGAGQTATGSEVPGIFSGAQSGMNMAGTAMMMYYLPKMMGAGS